MKKRRENIHQTFGINKGTKRELKLKLFVQLDFIKKGGPN